MTGAVAGIEPAILWLDDPRCQQARLVGGKAASLARLAADHSVPPGFALAKIPVDYGEPFTTRLQDAIASAYRQLARRCGIENPATAVRSSALDEDGPATSFAGVHDSFLNVVGLPAIFDAIQKCWLSAVSSRARVYRQQHGLPVDDIEIAVLAQQFVPADVSGVAFSVNPLTGAQDEIVINAGWGLGESVVGGTITPDACLVGKSDLRVASYDIGSKLHMTVPVSGGTRNVETPRFLRERPCLTAGEVETVARMTRQLEQQMDGAVDIEWAIAEGELFLLQCRPVTT